MSATVDRDVRDEIQTNLDVTLCVEAGAGAGKTTALVGRIVELIRCGRTTIDRLAVITFTEAAAAELISRVRERLEEGRRAATDAEQERIAAAVDGLHRARIETIHAFCRHLLAERPVEARLDPAFETLDGLRQSLSFNAAYAAWARDRLDGDSPVLRRAFNRGLDSSHLGTVVEEVHRHRALLPFAPVEPGDPPIAAFLETLEDAAAELAALAGSCIDDRDRGLRQIAAIEQLRDDCRRWAGDPERLERILLRTPKIRAEGNQQNWRPANACKQQKEICKQLNTALDALRETLRREALCSLIEVASEFVLAYAEQRRERGIAEFDDLLIWARDLLRDNHLVRRYFQRRFDVILVDEFQDTDPLQVEIVLRLASLDDDGLPAPGRLFLVGDPKQSIYRFRRADVATYLRVRDEIIRDGTRRIVQNFRSVAGVIDWVNRVFAGPLSGEGQVGYADLVAHRDDGQFPAVALAPFDAAGSTDRRRGAEAEAVAAAVREAVDDGWLVSDDGVWRPARLGDIVVLLPNRNALTHFEQALGSAGIPFRHEGGRAFFDRQEVRELLSLLHALDDPTDGVALLAALRSSAFGCSDDEIAAAVTDGWRLDYRQRAPVGPVDAACQSLRGLHERRRGLSLVPLLLTVLAETRLVEFALALPNGDQAAANLLKVVDQARAFAEGGNAGLRPFVEWIEQQKEARADESDAPVADRGDDVVRLLTVHAAKGLEFPIVVLSGLAEGTSTRPLKAFAAVDPAINRASLHLSFGNQTDGYIRTPGYEDAEQAERRQQEAERQRLLYVAATRARDHLVVPVGLDGEAALPMAGGLHPLIWPEGGPVHPDQRILSLAPPSVLESAPPVPPDENDLVAARAARADWQADRARLLADGSRSPDPIRIGEDSRLAAALHEAIANSARHVDARLADFAERVARRSDLDADELLRLLKRFRASAAGRAALATRNCHWGDEVVLSLADGTLVEGLIDARFDRTVVVALAGAVPVDTLGQWRRALAEAFALAGNPVDEVSFVACGADPIE